MNFRVHSALKRCSCLSSVPFELTYHVRVGSPPLTTELLCIRNDNSMGPFWKCLLVRLRGALYPSAEVKLFGLTKTFGSWVVFLHLQAHFFHPGVQKGLSLHNLESLEIILILGGESLLSWERRHYLDQELRDT